jgi:putative effector of murein hydrolase LrgA (UPF0299 family)
VKAALREPAAVVLGLAALWSVTRFCAAFATAAHLPIPSFVLAGAVLTAVLATGRVELAALDGAAKLLARHLPLFLIPVATGLLDQTAVLTGHGLQIGAVLLISATAGLAVTGRTSQRWLERAGRGTARWTLPEKREDYSRSPTQTRWPRGGLAMNGCELCGRPIERLAVRLEFSYYARACAPESSVEALRSHHDCGTRAYLALLDGKLADSRSPSLPAQASCDLCKSPLEGAEPQGLLVQLFAAVGDELRLAAEFGLRGHAGCIGRAAALATASREKAVRGRAAG